MSDRVKIQDALARLVAKREEQERRLMQPRTILADNDDEETRKDVRAASDVGRDAGQTSFSMASLMNNLPRQGHETNLSDVSLLDKIHSSLIPRKVAKLPPPPLQAAPPPPRIREELKLDEKIAETLYPHQKIGVEWLFSLHKQQKGGILGDDMVRADDRLLLKNLLITSNLSFTGSR
jgi:SNF2 family DNA or RNA helicase